MDEVRELRDLGLDLWDEHPRPPEVVARVAPTQRPALDAAGIDYAVVVPDLQVQVDLEHARLIGRPAAGVDFYSDFRTLAEIDGRLDELATAHPELVNVFEAGLSLEGRSIRGLEIAAGADKPVLFINAGQHAREWIAVMTGICVAENFVTRAEEPSIAAILDQVALIVVPVVNPDGYVYSWESERFWRKNRRDGIGVDLNRNFSIAWGEPGASADPQAGNYHGEAAFSEPESTVMRSLVQDHPDILSHVDLHSFGQLVLYPWSFTEDQPPAFDVLDELAVQLADALTGTHGVPYTPLQGSMLYPASGTFPDWSYGEQGIHAFTFELRPEEVEEFNQGFVLPPSEIPLVCSEAMAALELLATWTADQVPGMPGDDGGASTTSSDTGAGSGSGSDGGAPSSGTGSGTGGVADSTTGAPMSGTVSGSDDGTGDATEGGDGCGCRQDESPPSQGWWLGAIVVLASRRRRRGAG